jgi:hypothetical protein
MSEFTPRYYKKENIKIGYTKYNKMKISHIFVNFYSS